MELKLIILFIICNVLNVIIQTIKSIATIKCGKVAAAVVNAIAYGFYTYIVILTVCELPIWLKVLVVGLANLVGVFVVKLCEEKARKDKLWKIEVTVPKEVEGILHSDLSMDSIPHNYISNIGKYSIFNIYCETQTESQKAKSLLSHYDAKYFVSESKIL
jgi:uncharacterized protein YebE (UPF0316 family)